MIKENTQYLIMIGNPFYNLLIILSIVIVVLLILLIKIIIKRYKLKKILQQEIDKKKDGIK